MKRALYGLAVALAAVLFVSVAARLWFSHVGIIPSNSNSPAPSPTPCIIKNVGTNPPGNVCDQCNRLSGHFTNRIPQQQPNGRDVLCCPDGMTFGTVPGTCVKAP